MSNASRPPRASMRQRVAIGLLTALAVSGATGGYVAWRRAHRPVVPPIQTSGLENEVIAAIDEASVELERSPDSADAWGKLGSVLYVHEMLVESLPFFERAEELSPSDVRWLYFRAMVLHRDKPDEAITILQRAVDLKPGDVALRLRLAEWLQESDRPEAESQIASVLALEPDNGRALLARGQILGRRGQWSEALAPLTAAADNPTASKAAQTTLAEAYSRLGNEKSADILRTKAAALPNDSPWPDPFINDAARYQRGLKSRLAWGTQLLSVNQFEAASGMLEQLARDYPHSAEANLALGKALMRLQPRGNAEAPLLKAVEINPQLHEGHFLLGLLSESRQNDAAAEERYRKVIGLRPNYGLAYFHLGIVLKKRGDKNGAIAAWRDAIKLRPELDRAHFLLGELLLQENQIEEAVKHLEIAGSLDEKNDKARALLGEARARKKSP